MRLIDQHDVEALQVVKLAFPCCSSEGRLIFALVRQERWQRLHGHGLAQNAVRRELVVAPILLELGWADYERPDRLVGRFLPSARELGQDAQPLVGLAQADRVAQHRSPVAFE